jgi:multiple sugar transport system substrate-binding protein
MQGGRIVSDKRVDKLVADLHYGRISRRTFLKQALALGLSAPAIGAFLSACGPTAAPVAEPTQAPAAQAPEPTAVPEVELPEEINVLLFSHDAEIQQAKGPSFEEKYPTKVVFENVVADDHRDKLIAAHRAGTSDWDTIPQWAVVVKEMASRDWLVDLTPYLEQTLLQDEDDLLGGRSLFNPANLNGKIYAVPDKVGAPILQWNTELLEKVGLDPERPKSWHQERNSIDEFVEYAKECTFEENGVQYWGYAQEWERAPGQFHALIQMYGGDSLDFGSDGLYGEPIMNSEEGVAALQWMVDLLHKHKCIDPASVTYHWVFDFTPGYLDGRTAFVSTWPFVTHVSQDPEQSKIVDKNAFAPNFAAETSASTEGPEFQAISAYAPHGPDAAWLWLEHMSSKEMMKLQGMESGWAPIYKSVLNDPEVTQYMYEGPVIAQSYEYPHRRYFTPDFNEWDEILKNHLHNALRQEATPKEALDATVEDIKAMRASAS